MKRAQPSNNDAKEMKMNEKKNETKIDGDFRREFISGNKMPDTRLLHEHKISMRQPNSDGFFGISNSKITYRFGTLCGPLPKSKVKKKEK